jgi:heme b synthase
LNTQEIKSVIENIVSFSNPILVLTGGEPLYRPDIFEIADYAAQKKLRVALASNGTLINPEIANKIKEAHIKRVSISIDGSNAKTHDTFRGISGSFEKAIQAITYLKEKNIDVQLNMSIANHNVDELEDVVKLAKNIGAIALHVFALVPVGCGLYIKNEEQLSPQKYEEVLNWFYKISKEVDLEFKATCAPHYYRIVKEHEKGLPKRQENGMHSITKGCLAGTGVCFISSLGQVQGCGYLPVSAGNVRELAFREIWEKSPLFMILRQPKLLKGKCRYCEYINVCSGCRARAYGVTGDYLDPEPYCIYEPKKMQK